MMGLSWIRYTATEGAEALFVRPGMTQDKSGDFRETPAMKERR
jgi:hypothetical protein